METKLLFGLMFLLFVGGGFSLLLCAGEGLANLICRISPQFKQWWESLDDNEAF